MPRMVRCSIIQASNAVPATEPLPVQKKAMVEKHVGLIRQAAAAGRADRVPAGDFQRAVFLRRARGEMVRDHGAGSRRAHREPDAGAGEGTAASRWLCRCMKWSRKAFSTTPRR